MPKIRVTARIPAAAQASQAGGGTLGGPYMANCKSGFPGAEYNLYAFAIYGLDDGDTVVWAAELGDGDEIIGPSNQHVLLLAYISGGGGTVTASVNGNPLPDTVTYTSDCSIGAEE